MKDDKAKIKSSTIHGIYAGVITIENLPSKVYYMTAQHLMSGVHKGWKGSVKLTYNSPDWKLYEALSDNIFLFSGAKTFQQVLDMSEAMLDSDGKLVPFKDFQVEAGKIFDQYNENWLLTEYNTAVDGAREADKWNDYTKTKVEYLRYLTSGDDTVCEICGPMDDTVLPIDDPFWNENYPPNHFECHCTTQPEYDEDEVTDRPDDYEGDKSKFDNNVGKTGMIFTNKHTYFQMPKQYKEAAANNFGLPLPAKHEIYK